MQHHVNSRLFEEVVSLRNLMSLNAKFVFQSVCAVPFIFIILVSKLFSNWFVLRFSDLCGHRLGHFAANTELYLCEKAEGINCPKVRTIDIFRVSKPVCNAYLEKKWRNLIPHMWPSFIVSPFFWALRILALFGISDKSYLVVNTQSDRDVHSLYKKYPPRIKFSNEEELIGQSDLRNLGIPEGAKFVCLTVRDSAYLASHLPGGNFDYHSYRDCDVTDYEQGCIALAEAGIFVVRMGARAKKELPFSHPRIIDYATNGMRSEFLDLYLASQCLFCVTNGTGFDALPMIFRKPILQVNAVPISCALTWSPVTLLLFKHHFDLLSGRELSLNEIFNRKVDTAMRTDVYMSRGVRLVDNSADELAEVFLEMVGRLNGDWRADPRDEMLQEKFWEIYSSGERIDSNGGQLHGTIDARYGAQYLRANRWWLE